MTRLAPVFAQVVARLYAARPDLRFVLPAASPVAGLVSDLCTGWPGAPLILDPRGAGEAGRAEKRAAFAAADVALAASGTVSLELAAADTPMVIAYDMGWLSRQIIGRMLRVDTVTLVNLVSETRSVPEFIGKACRPDPIATALLQVLDAPEPQRAAMALTMQRLGQGGAAPGTRRAIEAAIAAWSARSAKVDNSRITRSSSSPPARSPTARANAKAMTAETGGDEKPWHIGGRADDRNSVWGHINPTCPAFNDINLLKGREHIAQVFQSLIEDLPVWFRIQYPRCLKRTWAMQ